MVGWMWSLVFVFCIFENFHILLFTILHANCLNTDRRPNTIFLFLIIVKIILDAPPANTKLWWRFLFSNFVFVSSNFILITSFVCCMVFGHHKKIDSVLEHFASCQTVFFSDEKNRKFNETFIFDGGSVNSEQWTQSKQQRSCRWKNTFLTEWFHGVVQFLLLFTTLRRKDAPF